MSDLDLDFFAPLRVSAHALERARERLGVDDEAAIRGEVRSAIAAGRVTDIAPNWTDGATYIFRDDGDVRSGVWYVWTPDVTHCWILARGGSGSLSVVSVALEHDYEMDRAADQRIRHGYRRA